MSRPKVSKLNVAIVHDWLVGGGAELVVLELHRMFPNAPIYTSYCTNEWREKLDNKVVTGWLQYFGFMRKFLALGRIWWFTRLDLSGYDLVISSSGNGEAMGVKVPEGTVHVNYCYTPTHYYWRHYNQYMKRPGFGPFDPIARLGLRLLVSPLRKWDLAASKRPDYFVAISTHIQADIKKYYDRDSIVIHPPVNTKRFDQIKTLQRSGFVTHGRQTGYKKLDVIVEACSRLGLPLTVSGKGPEHDHLEAVAGPSVNFIYATDEALPRYLAGAEAYLFASFEDFGIAPLEAMAAGTPVIAYKAGGALDYVIPGVTGEFFAKQTPEALAEVLTTFDPDKYDPEKIRAQAEQFSELNFVHHMREFLDSLPELNKK